MLALLAAATPGWNGAEYAGMQTDAQLDELSGLAASHAHPGIYWANNDSGNGAALFAIRPTNGERSLLACDFTSQDRPALVTALLSAFLTAANGGSLEPLEIWNLPVSTRHLWLIRIAAALDATTALTFQLRCQQAHCHEWLEVSLPIGELEALHDKQAANETLALTSIEASLTLRRPTRRRAAAHPALRPAAAPRPPRRIRR